MSRQSPRLIIAALILAITAILPAASRAGDNTWTTTGPYGFSIGGLYIDPRNDQVMYATTVGATVPVYKSTDGGITWRPSSTGIVTPNNYALNYGLAFDKDNSNIVYFAQAAQGPNDGLYRSVDGGATWERKSKFVDNGQLVEIGAVSAVTVSPLDGAVYIGASVEPVDVYGGIFRSTDKGETWERLAGLREQTVSSLIIAPSAPNIFYAAGHMMDGMYKSLDGGQTWASIGDAFGGKPSVNVMTVDPNNSQIVYVSIVNAGLFRTSNGGATWQPIGQGINGEVKALAIDPNNQQVLYAGSAFSGVPGVYRSLDSTGSHWEFFSDGMGSRNVTSIALDQRRPQSIFAGSPAGIWKRTMTSEPADFGVSINAGALFTNNPAVELTLTAPDDTSEIMLSNDGGFAGAQWESFQPTRSWTITSLGATVLPRTVYVRFRTNGETSGLYLDDIVLDQKSPTGTATIVSPAPAATSFRQGLAQSTDRPYQTRLPLILQTGKVQLTLDASDDLSGVGEMRIASSSSFANTQWQPFSPTTDWTTSDPQSPIYVQFRDRALNVSTPVLAIRQ